MTDLQDFLRQIKVHAVLGLAMIPGGNYHQPVKPQSAISSGIKGPGNV